MTEENVNPRMIDPSPFRRFGFWAASFGTLGVIFVLVQIFGPTLQSSPSVGEQIGEIAGDIRKSAWRSLLGVPPPAPEPAPTISYFGFAGAVLGAIAIFLSLISRIQGENWRYATYGTGLGIAAITLHFFWWIALLIVGVMLLVAIIENMGDIFGA